MIKAILVIGPDDDYLGRLKSSSFKELIDLIQIEAHLRARTSMEDGDIVDMVQRLLHDEEIDGVQLTEQFGSEMDYFNSLPDDVSELLQRKELVVNGMDDDSGEKVIEESEDEDNQLRIIGVGPESFVPTISHDFVNKLALDIVLTQSLPQRGEYGLESAEGGMVVTGTGSIDQLDIQAIEEKQPEVRVIYTTDDEEVRQTNLPYAVYVVGD